jgi:hypothetical protein
MRREETEETEEHTERQPGHRQTDLTDRQTRQTDQTDRQTWQTDQTDRPDRQTIANRQTDKQTNSSRLSQGWSGRGTMVTLLTSPPRDTAGRTGSGILYLRKTPTGRQSVDKNSTGLHPNAAAACDSPAERLVAAIHRHLAVTGIDCTSGVLLAADVFALDLQVGVLGQHTDPESLLAFRDLNEYFEKVGALSPHRLHGDSTPLVRVRANDNLVALVQR